MNVQEIYKEITGKEAMYMILDDYQDRYEYYDEYIWWLEENTEKLYKLNLL